MTTNGTEERPLPDGWKKARIDEVATLLRGVSYKKAVASLEPKDGHLPILRATNIQDENLVLNDDLVFVPKEFVGSEQLLQKNDIVICMSSGSKHLVGKAARLTNAWHGSFGTFCAAVRFDSAIEPRFAGYYFGSQTYRNFIREKSSGVNINNLRRGDIENLEFPIPPLQEQEDIANEIEKQFTRLDQAVASLRRLQSNLARYKASVLKAACNGRLVPQDPNDEPAADLLARILAERRAQWQAANPGKRYQEPVGVEGETAVLPKLPEGWAWAMADQVCDPIPNGSTPKSHKMYADSGEVPFLKVYNLTHDGSLDFSIKPTFIDEETHVGKLKRSIIYPGDVLMNIVGPPLGKVSIVPNTYPEWNMNQAIVSFRPILPDLNNQFLSYIFLAPTISMQLLYKTSKTTAGQRNLNVSACRRMILPLPPANEQERIVAEVERRLSVVTAVEQTITTNLSRAERLRQSILHRAFTGQLVPQEEVAINAS